eukprot:SAG22_NODE_2421_length_2593_cov_1.123897_2_plen_258_part_00
MSASLCAPERLTATGHRRTVPTQHLTLPRSQAAAAAAAVAAAPVVLGVGRSGTARRGVGLAAFAELAGLALSTPDGGGAVPEPPMGGGGGQPRTYPKERRRNSGGHPRQQQPQRPPRRPAWDDRAVYSLPAHTVSASDGGSMRRGDAAGCGVGRSPTSESECQLAVTPLVSAAAAAAAAAKAGGDGSSPESARSGSERSFKCGSPAAGGTTPQHWAGCASTLATPLNLNDATAVFASRSLSRLPQARQHHRLRLVAR